MRKTLPLGIAFLLLAGSLHAATFTVTNSNDSGGGSLRWAITQANASVLADLITFTVPPRAGYRVIKPTMELSAMTGAGDRIDGDLNDDGRPDVVLAGWWPPTSGDGIEIRLPAGSAARPLVGRTVGCSVIGLSIINFQDAGIRIKGRNANTVQSCCIGVDRLGKKARPNGYADIFIEQSDYNLIGGDEAVERNLIGAGVTSGTGLVVTSGSRNNRVIGNYFGLQRDGQTQLVGVTLGPGNRAATFVGGFDNRFGGPGAGDRNVVGYCKVGLKLVEETDALVQGNYFGLGADGSTEAPIAETCVAVAGASTGIRVGGASPAAGNVFCGKGAAGVRFRDAQTMGNEVQGNLFGLNPERTNDVPTQHRRHHRMARWLAVDRRRHALGRQQLCSLTRGRGCAFQRCG